MSGAVFVAKIHYSLFLSRCLFILQLGLLTNQLQHKMTIYLNKPTVTLIYQ